MIDPKDLIKLQKQFPKLLEEAIDRAGCIRRLSIATKIRQHTIASWRNGSVPSFENIIKILQYNDDRN